METDRIEPTQPAASESTPAASHSDPPEAKAEHVPQLRLNWKSGLVLAVVIATVVIAVCLIRSSHAATNTDAAGSGDVTVAVAKVNRENLSSELPRYGEFRPYVEVPSCMPRRRVTWSQMNVDFGDKVSRRASCWPRLKFRN